MGRDKREYQRQVYIFFDVFEICKFKDRLEILPYTLPPADIVATKLQVAQMTERELKDLMRLLPDYVLGMIDETEVLYGAYLAKLALILRAPYDIQTDDSKPAGCARVWFDANPNAPEISLLDSKPSGQDS